MIEQGIVRQGLELKHDMEVKVNTEATLVPQVLTRNLAVMEEHAKNLAEEIQEKCKVFRTKLQEGRVYAYHNDTAKLHYDLAISFYKYYLKSPLSDKQSFDNLLAVKKYLKMVNKALSLGENTADIDSRAEHAIIVKAAKEFMQPIKKHHDELKQRRRKIVNSLRIIINKITKRDIVIEIQTGSTPGRKSWSMTQVLSRVKEQVIGKDQSKRIKIKALNELLTILKDQFASGAPEFNLKNAKELKEIKHFLIELIDINLKIGSCKKADLYIENLKMLEKDMPIISEFEYRCHLIKSLNKIANLELQLLIPTKDDVEFFLIANPKTEAEYEATLKKWQEKSAAASILLVKNCHRNEWEAWCFVPNLAKSIFKLNVVRGSILFKFLEHKDSVRLSQSLTTELLDILTEKGCLVIDLEKAVFYLHDRIRLHSKDDKVIQMFSDLSDAYAAINYKPLSDYYKNSMEKIEKSRSKFKKELFSRLEITSNEQEPLSRDDIHHENKEMQEHQTPTFMFPMISWCGTRRLNDPIADQEFISEILPKIDQIPGLKRTINIVYDIFWKKTAKDDQKKDLIVAWHNYNVDFKKQRPYQKQYLLLYVEDAERWYFYGELENGRISEGYLNEKDELLDLKDILEGITLQDLESNQNQKIEKEQLLKKTLKALDTDKGDVSLSEETEVIKAMAKDDYQSYLLSKNPIITYDLSKYEQNKLLRDKIKSTDKNFSCIVRLSEFYYVALLFSFEQNAGGKEPMRVRNIYIMDSNNEKLSYEKIEWFTGIVRDFKLKLSIIDVPKQKLFSKDSFIHSYFSAFLTLWALEHDEFEFVKDNLSRLELTSSENIEKIKMWWIGEDKGKDEIDQSDIPEEVKPILDILNKRFGELVKTSLSQVKISDIKTQTELLSKTLRDVRKYEDLGTLIDKQIKEFQSEKTEKIGQELHACIQFLNDYTKKCTLDKKLSLSLRRVTQQLNIMLECQAVNIIALRTAAANLMTEFNAKFHESIVDKLLCKTQGSKVFGFQWLKDLKILMLKARPSGTSTQPDILQDFTWYKSILQQFKLNIVKIEGFKNAIEIADLIKKIENALNKEPLIHESGVSLTNIKETLNRFIAVGEGLETFHLYYELIIRHCYDTIELSDAHQLIKSDIYERIHHKPDTFEDIEQCLDILKTKAYSICEENFENGVRPALQKAIVEPAMRAAFAAFNHCLEIKDTYAVHYLGAHIRSALINKLDQYMKTMAKFRHMSLSAIEEFAKILHQTLTASTKEIIKNALNKDAKHVKHAVSAFECLNKALHKYGKVNYRIRLEALGALAKHFESQNILPQYLLRKLSEQLQDCSHSHYVYLEVKLKEISDMLERFAFVEKKLEEFFQLFWESLHNRYDHMPHEKVFTEDGMIQKEVLSCTKPGKDFSDIIKISQTLSNPKLSLIITQFNQFFVKCNDEKGAAEISESLRYFVHEVTLAYSNSLLVYRHNAMTTLANFMRHAQQDLASFAAISHQRLRAMLENSLTHLKRFNPYHDGHYKNCFSIFKGLVQELGGKELQHLFPESSKVLTELQKVFNETKHTLRPLFPEIINNLSNLLDNYVNWLQIETIERNGRTIYQIKMTAGVLSDVIETLKNKYPTCFSQNNEIRILSAIVLHVDVNLNKPVYSGVSFSLIGPRVELISDKPKFIVDISGIDAEDKWKDKPAANGNGNEPSRHGRPGEDGNSGLRGTSAGHLYIETLKLPILEVRANGGDGGTGQAGGNGSDGIPGSDGVSVDSGAFEQQCKDRWGDSLAGESHRAYLLGTEGQSGGNGGDAGAPGTGGFEGARGTIVLRAQDNPEEAPPYTAEEGKPGADGAEGKPGQAGKNGKDGRDCQVVSDSRGGWVSYVFTGLFSFLGFLVCKFIIFPRKYHVKTGHIYFHDRAQRNRYGYEHHHDEGTKESHFPFWGMMPDEEVELRRERDRERRRGKERRAQHKNRQQKQIIYPINRQHVFQQTFQFFAKFCNPKNKNSYQHWLAASLNAFLAKMAAGENLPYEDFAARNIDEEIQQILVFKDRFSEMVALENQRLQAEKIDTDGLGVGVQFKADSVLAEYNAFQVDSQAAMQALQAQIQAVNVANLRNGLQNQVMSEEMTRMLNERRINSELAASQNRLNVLVEMTRQDPSKSSHVYQIKVDRNYKHREKHWQKFEAILISLKPSIIQKFNENPSETTLLEVGSALIEGLKNQWLHASEIHNLSKFIDTFIFNFRICDFGKEKTSDVWPLDIINKWINDLNRLGNSTIEKKFTRIINEFAVQLTKEHHRYSWIDWTYKTIHCLSLDSQKGVLPHRRNADYYLTIVQSLKEVDIDELDSLLAEISTASDILHNFSGIFAANSKFDRIMGLFADKTNKETLLLVFQHLIKELALENRESFWSVITNENMHRSLAQFTQVLLHNLNIMDLSKNYFIKFTAEVNKLIEHLDKYPKSSLHYLFYDFSKSFEMLKENYFGETSKGNKKINARLPIIKIHSIDDKIAAFNTTYNKDLGLELLTSLVSSSKFHQFESKNKELIIGFLKWFIENINEFEEEAMQTIWAQSRELTKVYLLGDGYQEFREISQYLFMMADYKKSFVDARKEIETLVEQHKLNQETYSDFLSLTKGLLSYLSEFSKAKDEETQRMLIMDICGYMSKLNGKKFQEELFFSDLKDINSSIEILTALMGLLSKTEFMDKIIRVIELGRMEIVKGINAKEKEKILQNHDLDEKEKAAILDSIKSKENITKLLEKLDVKIIERFKKSLSIFRDILAAFKNTLQRETVLEALGNVFGQQPNWDINEGAYLIEQLRKYGLYLNEITIMTSTSHNDKLITEIKLLKWLFETFNLISEKIKMNFNREEYNILANNLLSFYRRYPAAEIDQIFSQIVKPLIEVINIEEKSKHKNFKKVIELICGALKGKIDAETAQKIRKGALITTIQSHKVFNQNFLLNLELGSVIDLEIILMFLTNERNSKSSIINKIYYNFYQLAENLCQYEKMKIRTFNIIVSMLDIINVANNNSLIFNKDNPILKVQLLLLNALFDASELKEYRNAKFIDSLRTLFVSVSELTLNKETKALKISLEEMKSIDAYFKAVTFIKQNVTETKAQIEDLQLIVAFEKNVQLIFTKNYIANLFVREPKALWLGIFNQLSENLRKKHFSKLRNIYSIILKNETTKVSILENLIAKSFQALQKRKREIFEKLLTLEKVTDLELKKKLLDALQNINGVIDLNSDKPETFNAHQTYDFNCLITAFNRKLKTDGGLLIPVDKFINILLLLACFENLRMPIGVILNRSQKEWLKVLLVEHIIEKHNLLFPESDLQQSLYQSLSKVDEKLLLLFNNAFVTEYRDQITEINELGTKTVRVSPYQKIAKEQFSSIVYFMNKIKVDKEILDRLAGTSLLVWDTVLYEIYFVQSFNKEILNYHGMFDEADCERTLLFLNRIRVKEGTNNVQSFMNFFSLAIQKILTKEPIDFKPLVEVVTAIYYQEISFLEAYDIVQNESKSWERNIISYRSTRYLETKDAKDRTSDELITEIIKNHSKQFNAIPIPVLKEAATNAMKYRSQAERYKKTIYEGDEKAFIARKIQAMLDNKEYQDNPEKFMLENLNEIVPVLIYAWWVANESMFPKHTQVLALLLCIYSNDAGLFKQISTGEGKTLIVGLMAAFKALCGYAVDIVSSNRDLAIEGEHKCRSFFELLKCSSGHVCSEDKDVNHKAYESHIVYGDVGYFQRDVLEQECNGRKTFGDRYKNKKKCLILDEVDSLGLDKARHVLYMSHEIEALKYLENVFINIWTAVLKAQIKETDDISKLVKDVTAFMLGRIKSKDVVVPKYLHKYVTYKMHRWVDSAFQARLMPEDDQFVLDIPKTDNDRKRKQRSIIIVDKDTGIEQYSTRWSDGLAQFMELKYRRKLSIESLKAVFISNKAFFQRYGNSIFGLTGTLGSSTSQRFLTGVYGVKFVTLPTSKPKRLRLLPSEVAGDYTEWLERITANAVEVAAKRPVEIILENIDRANSVEKALLSKGVSPQSIIRYIRDGDDVENRFRRKPATAGDIIITTNKGGRGTDVHVDDAVDIEGGMEVILGYLPENDRIEDQGTGRTARGGKQGTARLIVQVDGKEYEELCKLHGLPLKELAELVIIKEKEKRDEREKLRLKELQQKHIFQLEVEEELFAVFNQFKEHIIEDILKNKLADIDKKLKEKVIEAIYGVLKDHWAFWLDRQKDQISQVDNSSGKQRLIDKLKHYLNRKKEIFARISLQTLLNDLVRKPEEAVQLGVAHLYVDRSQDKSKEQTKNQISCAKQCFERAIELKDNSGFAYIGLAFCIIKLADGGESKIKKEARRAIKEAINTLEAMKVGLMANLKIADVLVKFAGADILQKVSANENYYQDQIQGKLEVIGLHLHYLKQAAGEYLEPFDFTNGSSEEAARNKSREIYDTLVNAGFIHGDVLRKKYKGDKVYLAAQIIRESIDPAIAEPLIHLLKAKSNDVFKCQNFEDIVCCNEELWQSLNLQAGEIESVYVIDLKRLEKELEARYENQWRDIREKINPNAVDTSLFEKNAILGELKSYLLDKKLMTRTRRVKVDYMKTHLSLGKFNFEGRYAKYGEIIFNQSGRESKGVQNYIKELITLKAKELQKNSENEGATYIYQDELPYGSKSEEAAKILIFLKENNILKSGGLCKHYRSDSIAVDLKHNTSLKDDIDEALDHALADSPFKGDKELIKNKLLAAQGDIRSYKDGVKASLKLFMDLEDQRDFPDELPFFMGLGLDKFLIIEEDKSWWDWGAFAVFLIGIAQIILGALLCVVGAANFGNALISEGINDMIYATMAMISGKFSWKDWIAQKIISFSISILTAGLQTLASIGQVAAKLGSISTMALVGKILTRCIIEVAVSVLTNVLTEAAVSEIQKNIIDKILNEVLNGLATNISETLEKDLEELCKREADLGKFMTLIYDLSNNIQDAIKNGGSVLDQFSSMQSQVCTALKGGFKQVVDGLKNSSSPYVKFIGAAINIAAIVKDLWDGVKSAIELVDTVKSFVSVIEKTINKVKDSFSNPGKGKVNASELQYLKAEIRAKINELKNFVKTQISEVLIKELRAALHRIINGAIVSISRSSNERVMGRFESQFKGQDPVAIARAEAAVQHAASHTKHVMEMARGIQDPKKLADRLKLESLQNAVSVLKTTPFMQRCQNQMRALKIPEDTIDRLSRVRSIDELRDLGLDIVKSAAKEVGSGVVTQLEHEVLQSDTAEDTVMPAADFEFSEALSQKEGKKEKDTFSLGTTRAPASISVPFESSGAGFGLQSGARPKAKSEIQHEHPVKATGSKRTAMPLLFQHVEHDRRRKMIIRIVRTSVNKKSITGDLYVDGKWICHTLELPDLNNKPFKSSIPDGEYGAILRYNRYSSSLHATREEWCLQLTGTQPRTGIQIHMGAKPEHSTGCILVGEKVFPEQDRLTNSLEALFALRRGTVKEFV